MLINMHMNSNSRPWFRYIAGTANDEIVLIRLQRVRNDQLIKPGLVEVEGFALGVNKLRNVFGIQPQYFVN